MAGRRVVAHQPHQLQVLAARVVVEVQPAQVAQLLGQLRAQLTRELGVVPGDLRARSAAAAVREQRDVPARGQPEVRLRQGEQPELDEVVAGAARAELIRRAVAQAGRQRRERPALVLHGRVIGPLAQLGAGPELRLLEQRLLQVRAVVERGRVQVEHRQLHPARDVHPDGVRDHGALGLQHAADRQPVATVRVRHQRAAQRAREPQRVAHLVERAGVGVAAVVGERRGRVALHEAAVRLTLVGHEPLRERPEVHLVLEPLGRRGHLGEARERALTAELLDRARDAAQRHPHRGPVRHSGRTHVASTDLLHASKIKVPGTFIFAYRVRA